MNRRVRKKQTRYILMGMIALALLTFTIFYVFLIDIFGLFTAQEQSIGSLTITQDNQEPVLSPLELDAQSSIAPVHGEESFDGPYPKKEITVLAHTLAQWLHTWYNTHNTEPFPIEQLAEKIHSLHFSEGNSIPSVEEIPTLLMYAFPFFIDALFTESQESLIYKQELQTYIITFTRQASAILDCIRTIPSLQQKDFTEMIRLTQHITTIQQELVTLNEQIQTHMINKNSSILPKLAERKFILQKTIQEQELVLNRYNQLFSSFYNRAQIKHLPSSSVHTFVSTFMRYAPQQQWNTYAHSLMTFMDTCTTTLENFELE